jgi:hypothetical protein
MTGYKISAATGILFYVMYPHPRQSGPFTKDTPCKKPAPLHALPQNYDLFFNHRC